MRGPSLSNNNA